MVRNSTIVFMGRFGRILPYVFRGTLSSTIKILIPDRSSFTGTKGLILVKMFAEWFNVKLKAESAATYNGQEALDLLENDSAFDIVLMDLEMPVMDGYTVIVEI